MGVILNSLWSYSPWIPQMYKFTENRWKVKLLKGKVILTKFNLNHITMPSIMCKQFKYYYWVPIMKRFSIGVAEKIYGVNSHGRGSRSKIHRKILALQHHGNRFKDHKKVIDFGVVHADKVIEGIHNDIKMGKRH